MADTSFLFFLLMCFTSVNGQNLESIPSSPVTKKPGETLNLSCKGSGFDFGQYGMHWIRQSAGQTFIWMGVIWYDASKTVYGKSVEGRIEITRDNSNNMVYLKLSGLTTEDTAVYYCAGTIAGGAFDYWGKGTMVTVTSAESSPPTSIFAMSQCTPDSTGYVTIGCMARGFSPADSLTFKWTDYNTKELSDFVQYPAFASGGEYTKVSHMRVRKSDLDPQKPYKCEASNSKGKKDSKVPLLPPPPPPAPRTAPPPVPRTAPPPVPRTSPSALTLKPPVQREIFVNNKVVLEAVVSGDIKSIPSCKVNDAGMLSVVELSTDISQSIKKYSLTVDTKKWFNGEKVTCTIGEIKQEISFNKGDGQKPTVFIYRPDNINTDRVSHVCEVTSPKLGDVYVMWKVGNEPYREGGTSAPIHQKDSMSVLSILTMTKQEYEQLSTTISCAVKHANMDDIRAPLQVSTSKSKQPELSCD